MGKTVVPTLQEFRARELIALEDAIFEEVDGRMMATVRVLRSGLSKNRRNYPPALVKEAVDKGIFNGIQMFIDHNRKNPEPQARGFMEMVSGIESTSWDEPSKSMDARVEFFDRNFYERAQAAKKYMGVSINALVRGTRRTLNGETFEDITSWVQPRSVDWVTAPAAGGAILAFEDEEDNVAIDWSRITIEDLRKHAPEVVQAIEAAHGPDDEPGDEPMTQDQLQKEIQRQVQEGIQSAQAAAAEQLKKRNAAATQIREAVTKSGLPEKTRARVLATFEDAEEYDEQAVADSIREAQEELIAAGAKGPQVTGMGPSGSGKDDPSKKSFSVHESVKSSFGITGSDAPKEGTK